MKYPDHQHELNLVTDPGLHVAFAKMSDEELKRVCLALHNNEDDVNMVAEGMVEQIHRERNR